MIVTLHYATQYHILYVAIFNRLSRRQLNSINSHRYKQHTHSRYLYTSSYTYINVAEFYKQKFQRCEYNKFQHPLELIAIVASHPFGCHRIFRMPLIRAYTRNLHTLDAGIHNQRNAVDRCHARNVNVLFNLIALLLGVCMCVCRSAAKHTRRRFATINVELGCPLLICWATAYATM